MFCTRYDKRKQFRLKYFCTGKNKVIGDNEKQTELKNIHLVILRPLECLRTVRDGYVSAHVACHVGLLPHHIVYGTTGTDDQYGRTCRRPTVFGPLSDKYGRRPVLSVALMLFLLSTAGCIFSENILQFITLRFLQGVSGAGGVVLSRSIAADKYSARELAGVLAVIGGINGVATVAAPIAGGFLADASGWQGIFWSLFLLGTILLAGSFRMEESHPTELRTSVRWNDILRNFSLILRNRQYLAYTLQYGFTMGVLFVNIASAPFIMQEHYGLSAMQFSLCFGANAIAMAIASTVAVKLPTMKDALHIGSNGMLWLSFAWLAALSQGCSFWIYETLAFALLSMAGITFTASNTLAMECERENAGVASALLGTAGFAVGGIMSPLVGLGNILFSTGMLFIFSSFLALLCTHYALSSQGFIRSHILEELRQAAKKISVLPRQNSK